MLKSCCCCKRKDTKMVLPALAIRNLTSTPTELKLIERFDTPDATFRIPANLTKSSFLVSKAESFTAESVSIRIIPFKTIYTDIIPLPNQTLRLTFETDGQRYRLNTPCPSDRSTVLTPLSPNPKHEYTAVYIPKQSYLALYSSAHLGSWMAELKDESPLAALSIPGTHNSPTCFTALPSVRCQAVGIREQLDNGVRFLDIRLQPASPNDPLRDGLILVHSAFPISLTGHKYFRDLVNEVVAFLEANPTETVIMTLKREGIGNTTDHQLSKILHDHYITDPTLWFTDNRIPALGEVRKKIVVIRRFFLDPSLKSEHHGTGWCIDAESWPDNCVDGMCSSGEIRVQDFYQVEESVNIDKKVRYSEAQLTRSAACVAPLPDTLDLAAVQAAKQPLFINFLSASNFFRRACWPEKIAAKVNPRIIDFLCMQHNEESAVDAPGRRDGLKIGDGATGIVVCDWVGLKGDWDLVRCIVGMNAKLEMREKGLKYRRRNK